MAEPWEARWIDYYGVLGVAERATTDEIRAAFRTGARRWHPDRLLAEPPSVQVEAEQKFKLLAEAYDVLSHPDRRRAYDVLWKQGGPPQPSTVSITPAQTSVRTLRGNIKVRARVHVDGPLASKTADVEVTTSSPDLELQTIDLEHATLNQPYPCLLTVSAYYSGDRAQMVDLRYRIEDAEAVQQIEIKCPSQTARRFLALASPRLRGLSPTLQRREVLFRLAAALLVLAAIVSPFSGWSAAISLMVVAAFFGGLGGLTYLNRRPRFYSNRWLDSGLRRYRWVFLVVGLVVVPALASLLSRL
jgi:curved DNA-binding protein CbpA